MGRDSEIAIFYTAESSRPYEMSDIEQLEDLGPAPDRDEVLERERRIRGLARLFVVQRAQRSTHVEGLATPHEMGKQQQEGSKGFDEVRTDQDMGAEPRRTRLEPRALGAILMLAGTVIVFLATISPRDARLVRFVPGHPLLSIDLALVWWGPLVLLLVAAALAVAPGRLVSATGGGLAIGIAGVILLQFAAVLLSAINGDAAPVWTVYLGLIGACVVLLGGLIAVHVARS